MAPIGGGKRKRGDRNYSGDGRDDGQRPSPHRPGNLPLGQQPHTFPNQQFHNPSYSHRGGPRRPSRGGRGGSYQQSPIDNPRPPPLSSRIAHGPINPSSFSSEAPQPETVEAPKQPVPNDGIPRSAETAEEEPVPFTATYYSHMTEDRIQQWKEHGREEILLLVKGGDEPSSLAEWFDEIIRSVTSSRVDPHEAGLLVKDIIGQGKVEADRLSDHDEGTASLFLDSLSIAFEAFNKTSNLLPMLVASSISPETLRLQLDVQLLERLGLIRSTFGRVGIRQTTNLLYRQSNYNLLREETEGYSKLVTELFTMSNSDPNSGDNVRDAFERVKGMIGAFDLDVGRVLDITLDVFAAVLVKQNRFFVKYLRASSWWPQERSNKQSSISLGLSSLPQWALPSSETSLSTDSDESQLHRTREERDQAFWQRAREIGMRAWFELGGAKSVDDSGHLDPEMSSEKSPSKEDDPRMIRRKANEEWVKITGTSAPSGNDIAAQVLGFKLRFYSSSARDPQDALPVNLIYLAALLIKIGFISLRDLYPHLWPPDDMLSGVRQQKLKEKADREKLNRPGGGALNALAAAGALADDTLPLPPRHRDVDKTRESAGLRETSAKPESRSEKTPDNASSDDRVDLPEASDQKVQLLKSLLCIGAIPEALFMLGRYSWLPEAFPDLVEYIHRILNHSLIQLFEQSSPTQPCLDILESEKLVDEHSLAGKGQLRFTDAPPRRTMRWAQLDRSDTGEGIDYKFYWDDWANNVPICRTTDDVFTLCSTFLNLSGVKIGQDAELLTKLARIGAHSLATDSSADNLKRWIDLSKRLLVPAISLTKNSPGAVSEVYELIRHFPVETRYSLYSEWFLGQVSRIPEIQSAFELAKAETKDVLKRISKTTIRPMARALAKIALSSPGIVFQVAINQIEAYNNLIETVVECARYFTYLGYDVLIWSIMNALQGRGRTRTKSAGMTVSAWLSAIALFSGKVFRRYSIMNPVPMLRYVIDQLRKHNSTDLVILEEIISSMAGITSDLNLNESQILAMAGGELLRAQTLLQLGDKRHETKTTSRRLLRALVDAGLVAPLVVLMAQERQSCVYDVPEDNADTKLLGNIFDEVNRILAQFLDLLRSNLTTQAFDEIVPSVDKLINDFGIDASVAFWICRQSLSAAMQRKGIDSPSKKVEGLQREESTSGRTGSAEGIRSSNPPAEGRTDATADLEETPLSESASSPQPWHPILQEVGEKIHLILPEEKWELMGRSFFVTFWTLTLRDMNVPLASYEEEIKKQNAKIDAINSDRTDISISGAQKKDREKKVLTDLQDRLRMEQKEHITVHAQSRTRLQKEKEHWFAGYSGRWSAQNALLIQHCFFPRMIMSPADSLYAFRIFKYLHSSGTKNFNTKDFLDQFFDRKLMSMIAGCSSKEAENLGRWLGEILRDLGRWHSDKAVFEKEAYGTKKDLRGFAKDPNKATVGDWYSYEDYRRSLYDWHMSLTSALRSCLNGGDYMRERNAMNVLKSVGHSFPVVNWMGNALIACVEKLTKLDKRPDTKTAAMFILGPLKRKESKGWVLPQAFSVREQTATTVSATKSGTSKPGTPLPMNLNPQVPDFQPSNRTSSKVDAKPRKPSQGRLGVEDGEIEDEKRLDAVDKTTPLQIVGHGQLRSADDPSVPEVNMTAGDGTKNAGSIDLKNQHQDDGPPSQTPAAGSAPNTAGDADARASPALLRPQSHRLISGPGADSSIPPDGPNHLDARVARSNDLRPSENPHERPLQETPNSRQSIEQAQEAIRERLSRDQPRRDQGSVRDSTVTNSRPSHHDANDYRRQNTIDVRSFAQQATSIPSPNNALGSQRARSDIPQPDVMRRSGGFNNSHYPKSMPPPHSLGSHHQDNQFPGSRENFSERMPSQGQIQGPGASRPGPARPDNAPYYGRQSREASPHRYDTRRIRTGDDRPSQEYQYPPNERHRSQMTRQHQQSFPKDYHTNHTGPYGQTDGSKDFRNGPADLEPRQRTRRSDVPYSHPDRQDPQYGRLNNDTDTPAGPRVTSTNPTPYRNPQATNMPHPHVNGSASASPRSVHPPGGLQDRPTPTGPSSGLPASRNGGHPARAEPSTVHGSSAPDTPDTAGVHPDRLKAIQSHVDSPTEPSPQRPNFQGDPVTGAAPPASMPSSGTPRGPSAPGLGHNGLAPTGRVPPNGPTFGTNRSDKRFAGIQDVLQQTAGPPAPDKSSQGTSIRGRGARARNPEPSSVDADPPTALPRTEPLPQEDLFAGRVAPPDLPPAVHDDPRYGRGRRRPDARDAFWGDQPRMERQRSRSPPHDPSSRPSPHDAEGRAFRRDERRPEPPLAASEHHLRRSTRDPDDRRLPSERRDGSDWNPLRGRGPPDRMDDRDRREGGGSTRKRFRSGEDGPPERTTNHGDKRTRHIP